MHLVSFIMDFRCRLVKTKSSTTISTGNSTGSIILIATLMSMAVIWLSLLRIMLPRSWLRLRIFSIIHPLRRFESHVLADAQLAIRGFQQIADGQRCSGFAQNTPRVILVQRFHFARRFELLRLGVSRSGNVGRPTELLPRRILHAEDSIIRHCLTL